MGIAQFEPTDLINALKTKLNPIHKNNEINNTKTAATNKHIEHPVNFLIFAIFKAEWQWKLYMFALIDKYSLYVPHRISYLTIGYQLTGASRRETTHKSMVSFRKNVKIDKFLLKKFSRCNPRVFLIYRVDKNYG